MSGSSSTIRMCALRGMASRVLGSRTLEKNTGCWVDAKTSKEEDRKVPKQGTPDSAKHHWRRPLRLSKWIVLHRHVFSYAKKACGIRDRHLPETVQYRVTCYHQARPNADARVQVRANRGPSQLPG